MLGGETARRMRNKKNRLGLKYDNIHEIVSILKRNADLISNKKKKQEKKSAKENICRGNVIASLVNLQINVEILRQTVLRRNSHSFG